MQLYKESNSTMDEFDNGVPKISRLVDQPLEKYFKLEETQEEYFCIKHFDECLCFASTSLIF